MGSLEICSQIAEIVTAIVAFLVSAYYFIDLCVKRRRLVDYLKKEKDTKPRRYDPGDNGRRSTWHLVAALRMSEDEILKAAFRSDKIKCSPAKAAGITRAEAVWLEYE